MKLRIKEQYKDWGLGGGKLGKIKLENLHPSLYQKYYDLGWADFFEVVKPEKKEEKIKTEDNDTDK